MTFPTNFLLLPLSNELTPCFLKKISSFSCISPTVTSLIRTLVSDALKDLNLYYFFNATTEFRYTLRSHVICDVDQESSVEIQDRYFYSFLYFFSPGILKSNPIRVTVFTYVSTTKTLICFSYVSFSPSCF